MAHVLKIFLFLGMVISLSYPTESLGNDLDTQFVRSTNFLLQNIIRTDVAPGAVIAATSKQHPDYFYHWVRDAALVLEANLDLYQSGQITSLQKQKMQKFFLDYISFAQRTQQTSLRAAGLGEPKFLVDGQVYSGPWGRPQNDGPALRSSSLTRMLGIAIRENWPQLSEMKKVLYQPQMPAQSLLKLDFEYTAKKWPEINVDLWEEVYGYHFYTLMAQRKSLLLATQVAQSFADPMAAQFYQQQLLRVSQELNRFWDANRGYIFATLSMSGKVQKSSKSGGSIKVLNKSQLDVAVILAVLHSDTGEENFSFTDDRVLSTFQKLADSFSAIYPINQNKSVASAWGRYPEDTYDGYQTNSVGNPWVLSTAGAGEFLYRLAGKLAQKSSIRISQYNIDFYSRTAKLPNLNLGKVIVRGTPEYQVVLQSLVSEADRYLLRVLLHANADGSLSEQMNRQNGFMQGAQNLSWSHASVITAKIARDNLRKYSELRGKL